MTDPGIVFAFLDRLGQDVVGALIIPSLEALFLGAVVWLILRLDQKYAPRIRHILWLLVIVKPLLSLVLPWQGPLPLPGFPVAVPTEAGFIGEYEIATYVYAAVAAVWALAVCVGIVWTLTGMGLLLYRSRQTMPIAVPWVQALFARCLSTVHMTRPVQLRMSDDFAGPTLVAIGKPMVVIPSWCLIQLSPQELKQVFLHELIHYTRRDHLTLLLVQAARICFFFHPLVWYAGRRIGVEAERACDLAVVTVAHRPQSYAASLLKVAEGALRARWRGALELARSASLTAVRIKEVLNGLDERRYAVDTRTVLLLALCGIVSALPLFHLPSPSVAPVALPVVGMTSIPPVLFDYEPVRADAVEPVSAELEEPLSPGQPPISRQVALSERPDDLPAIGAPYVLRPITAALYKPGAAAPVVKSDSDRPEFHPSMHGLLSPASPIGRSTDRSGQLEPGQIEVQSTGNTLASQGVAGVMTLRAGYFVTRTHEFGGVLSIIGPGDRIETAAEQAGINTPVGLSDGRSVATKPLSDVPVSLISSPSFSSSQETGEENGANNKIRIGAFYRYNIADFDRMFVPFVGIGTGIEVRPGNNPRLVESGGGVRCFFAKSAALIVQIDYVKDVELSTRSHINASLGFSTIF